MPHCEAIPGLNAVTAEWTELAERSGSVFATPEWARIWWAHFGGPEPPTVLRCDRGGGAFALAPVYRDRRGPLRVLRFVGHGAADVLGPVCDPRDAAEAGEAVLNGLREGLGGRWNVFLAERVPAGPLADSMGGRVLQAEANPSLEIEGRSWDEYLAASSKNLREKLRRNTRKLEREHELRYRLCEDSNRLEQTLDALFRLHGMRWSEGSSFQGDRILGFHRDFSATAMREGWLRLWTMELDDVPVAAWYGFRFGATEAYYQSGRDPSYDRFSVGFLLLMRTIQAAFEDGLERYSFLRGDETYKGRFATAEDLLETRAIGRTALSRAAVRAGDLALRCPPIRRRAVSAMR